MRRAITGFSPSVLCDHAVFMEFITRVHSGVAIRGCVWKVGFGLLCGNDFMIIAPHVTDLDITLKGINQSI